ncbi:hypothetical protein ZWY2020_028167 [Hordeum vulgare]|nr:hypothetical protein ZWY2020_028167 [Hordeum vulgare]
MGQASKRLPASLRLHLFIMSSGGDLNMGHEILFGALSFIVDDSAWLRDAPLDVEALPSRGATHFHAGTRGILLLQQSAPVSTYTAVARRNKRSRHPWLQRWVQHAQARQNASSQVAVLESVVVAPPSQRSDSVPTEFPSKYLGRGPAAEVHMANSHESPSQTGRNEHEVGETSGPRRQPRCSASRYTRRSNVEVFRTPVLNLAAAAKIAASLQPTDSEAGRGIEKICALLHTAQQQNSALSQSHNRIHNSSVHTNTHRTFEGTCKRPAGLVELQHCVQKQNEPLRDFIQRWTTLYHTVENVTEHQAVCAFKGGVRYRNLYLKFGRTGDISMSKMMEIAARYANGEEEDHIHSGKHKAVADGDGNITRKQKQKAPSTPQAEAAAVTNAKLKGKGKAQFTPKKKQFGNHILDQPCPIHTKMDEEGNAIFPKHTTRQCRLLIQGFSEGQPSEKDNEQDEEDKEDPFPQIHATLMIFADVESKSRLKLVNREVNMATPTNPTFLKWSHTAFTFDQSDHPAQVPTRGRQTLVVDPVVEGVRPRKVLMDGGSGLNIMYADTLKGMGIPMSKLSESSMQFHGVVPGRKAKSLGQIALDVVFGSDKNFRKEKLTFEVVDFQSAYHAILGHPAYARFMARPCYVYLKLKMPGPKGVITITGNRQRAEECL